ncbi:hypothetical protein ABD91_17810 [Lysinibacillus sphaericus]|uniref:hypothetical protein n=1 Tax=Lysinibacillus sphaericus TaxID=1421 RepID=UPI0018CF5B2B|nr:hypothetical protein [Lysinibacillus sphaericus]MBG9692643.1 hypothetical protein [Lysinibacillus sphaericus]
MTYEIQYHSQEERQNIIETNKSLFLIGERNITEGNFLIFSDERPKPPVVMVTVPKEEFDAVKEENKELKLAIAESVEAQQQDKIENQLAIAELAELIASKEVL